MHDLQTEVAKTGTELREAVAAAALAWEAAERSGADLRGQLSAATAQAEQLNTQLLSVKAAAFDSHLADRNSRCISGHLFCAALQYMKRGLPHSHAHPFCHMNKHEGATGDKGALLRRQ